MAGLQDLLEAYKNYRGVQDWKLGQQMNRVPGAEEAMDLWGGWDTGGLAGAIKAYHGSPRAEPFTRFDSAHMGSGEGAQAFGKGHYLAERPGIAKAYAEMRGPMFEREISPELQLSSDKFRSTLKSGLQSFPQLNDFKLYIETVGRSIKKSHKQLSNLLKDPKLNEGTKSAILDQLDSLSKDLQDYQSIDLNNLSDILVTSKPKRSLYEASLEWPGARESVDPMSREHFFQWDRQFSTQPKHVKEALFDIIEQHPEIAEPYAEWLARHNVPGHTTHSLLTLQPQATIKAMEGAIEPLMYERGIPGVAFLDQPSRIKKVGDRTYNYVAFGDKIPRIISHNKPSVLDMLWPKK